MKKIFFFFFLLILHLNINAQVIILNSPSDGEFEVNPFTNFIWEPYEGASNYTIQISDFWDFDNPLFTHISTNSSITLTEPLNDYTSYQWRVKADNGDWSDIWSFSTGVNPVPKLIEPRDGFTEVPSTNAFLSWSWVNNAENFRVEISQDPDFNTLYYFEENLISTVFNLSFTEGSTYYWRVRSQLNGEWQPWSNTQSFTVNTINIYTPEYKFSTADYTANSQSYSEFGGALIGDIKGDGIQRLITGNGGGGSLDIYRYENNNLVFETSLAVLNNPVDWSSVIPKQITDIDNDGLNEIIVVADSYNGDVPVLQIYKWDGVNYSRILNKQGDFYIWPAAGLEVADVDRDGSKEFLMLVNGRLGVYEYNTNDFTKVWEFQETITNLQFAVGDVDGDGNDEIVMGSQRQNSLTQSLYVVEFNGSNYILESEIEGFDYELGGISINDFDNNGTNEIIAGYGGTLNYLYKIFVLSYNGNDYSIIHEERINNSTRNYKTGDIDRDGTKEVVLFGSSYGLYVCDFENGIYNFGTLNYNYSEFGDLGDLDNDGSEEIAIPSGGQLDIVSIFSQLPNVQLISPYNNEYDVNPLTTFMWQEFEGATSYTLQISYAGDFENPQFSYEVDSTSFKLDSPLSEQSWYQWRVKANNSLWSDIFVFTSGVLPIPKLIEPKDGYAEVPSTGAFFLWKYLNNTEYYQLEISEDPEFTTIFFTQETPGPMVTNVNLIEGSSYYWRVRAFIDNQWQDWSAIYTFTVNTVLIELDDYKTTNLDLEYELNPPDNWWGVNNVMAGDTKGDGITRILIGDGENGKVRITRYENNQLIIEDELIVINNPYEYTNVMVKAIDDINNDGQNEFIVIGQGTIGDYTPPVFRIYRWNGSEYEILLERTDINIAPNSPLLTYDIDKDGALEIIMTPFMQISVWDYDNNTNDIVNAYTFYEFVSNKFAIDDLDGDGYNELYFTNYVTQEGSPQLIFAIECNDGYYHIDSVFGDPTDELSDLIIADINNDGQKELVSATPGGIRYYDAIYIFNYSGSEYTKTSTLRIPSGISSSMLGDIDGDGENEIVMISSRDGSFILDYEEASINLGVIHHSSSSQGVNADIDLDGSSELIYSSLNTIRIISVLGENDRVVPIAPVNEAVDVELSPTFSWNPFAGAFSYTLQISSEEDFSSLISDNSTLETSYTLPDTLDASTTYFWRVTADNSLWSLTRSFTTIEPVTIEDKYDEIILFLTNLPDESFKKPAGNRRRQLINFYEQSRSKYECGNTLSAIHYIDTNIMNHLTQKGNGNNVWITNEEDLAALVAVTNELIELLNDSMQLEKKSEDGYLTEELPTEFSLSQNYPNPFNPSTRISFSVPVQCNVSLSVYDMLGSEVASLVNKFMSPGNYEVTFNGSNLASGMYIYKLQAGNFTDVKKLVLLK